MDAFLIIIIVRNGNISIFTWPENRATTDIEWMKHPVQKWYQASLGYIIELSYNNNNYDVVEFENIEDYEVYKVTKYTRIQKTGENIIKIDTSDMFFFLNTKDSACDNKVKILMITIGDPSFTLTPTNSPAITPDILII